MGRPKGSIGKREVKLCAGCGEEFLVTPFWSRSARKKTCSVACRGLLQRKGGPSQHEGYREFRFGGLRGKKEHRLVMEKMLGRVLRVGETVHHWDENKQNNGEDNLQFFRRDAAHQRLHHFARRHRLPVLVLKFAQPWLYAGT